MESKFIIRSCECVDRFVALVDECAHELQAELWSVFIGIARKSHRNLECCVGASLTGSVLARLPAAADDVIAGSVRMCASHKFVFRFVDRTAHCAHTVQCECAGNETYSEHARTDCRRPMATTQRQAVKSHAIYAAQGRARRILQFRRHWGVSVCLFT
jgi:hypothetical protein